MGLIASNPGRSIANVFEEKIPNYGDSAGEERRLVGPELIWLPPVVDLQCSVQVTWAGRARKQTQEVLWHIDSFAPSQNLPDGVSTARIERAGELVPQAPAGVDKGSSQVLRGRVKRQWSFQWIMMKGFFWNQDPTAREVVQLQRPGLRPRLQQRQAVHSHSKSVRLLIWMWDQRGTGWTVALWTLQQQQASRQLLGGGKSRGSGLGQLYCVQ